jgi:hypothetical protein
MGIRASKIFKTVYAGKNMNPQLTIYCGVSGMTNYIKDYQDYGF